MAATTMQPTKTLLKTLQRDFSDYTFVQGPQCMWSSRTATITHTALTHQTDIWDLLHEIAHAELNHAAYTFDIQLMSHEAQAWAHAAKVLAPRYAVRIDPNHIQDSLDTYRQWLHKRSQCPGCGQNGFQTTQNTYNCSNCRCLWRVNEARSCRLRRTRLLHRSA